ncbi:MAG: GTP pyrophosphokinase [Deltaproteobacteria bacterium CG2_30_63_29]|nr:MAG: GTP pyrophosphokinase [Deltaproteobacteria bacterium CG2_30_63_29]
MVAGEPKGLTFSLQQRFDRLKDKVCSYHPAPDIVTLRSAFEFAVKCHEGQFRKSGEPYIIHPIEVTEIVAELKLDVASLCASLLHDVVEDTSTTLEELKEHFGEEVAFLVDGLTKLSKLTFNTREERQAESFRKMIVAMSRDLRVILVKLCDRVHNMRTLEHMPEKKQQDISQETLDIYAPLANRLGISWIKVELQDLALRYLHPEESADLIAKIAKTQEERQGYIEEVLQILHRVLADAGLKDFELQGRPKHIYSVYTKMKRSNVEIGQVHDMLAFRVMVDSVPQCYEALGIIHNHWKPIPGRFKDYIAIPKPNMYQSLHTSVIGPYQERIEVQIRTREMHRVAEEGIAAHWMYKEGRITPGDDEKKFAWLRQLVEWQQDLTDPKEFLETVKIDLFADEVYVFTPKGEVRSFPKGSTPLDFAYAVHTEVGHHCAGARVNGQLVPLRHQLQNGDIIEIITSANQRPKQDWLQFVVSSRARTKIRQVVRKEQRGRSQQIGRQLLEKTFRRYGLNLAKLEKAGELEKIARSLKCANGDEIQVNVGLGKLQPETVAAKFAPPEEEGKEPTVQEEGRFGKLMDRLRGRSKTGINVDGVEDMMVRFAKCCAPVPGEPIIGFVTRGRGVTVHAADCTKSALLEPERQVDCYWDIKSTTPAEAKRAVNVRVVCADRPGMLSNISQSFSVMGINITQAHCRTTEDKRAVNTFEVLVKDIKQLQTAIKTLARIPGVYSVERVRG